ncbi:acyl-CoA dehydrogenase family protein [Bordetella sp. BOR01]|uniref:acyl-CoA dehydrogenase family protein n=1 Tax=Bordetella sp. BOR01 TaxID=2854779 RepID=UPI001C43BD22|nr:acyl-CoA dehydrogenase family protein [Bordetella sp. BOR01]MBV7482325.1 acyl-CoA dehydrogenase family protein [Bordetella sp. BOR01]
MNMQLDAEHLAWQQQVRAFVRDELVPLSSRIEAEARIPQSAIARLRDMGLFGTHTPRQYGGLGLSMLGSCIAVEELAAAHIAFYYTCGVNIHIGSKAIEIAGTEAQKRDYLAPLARGEFIGALAMTEPQAGSDAAAIATRAVRQGDRYVLNGSKTFITNAQIADCFTVIARTADNPGSGGLSAFIVPGDTPGLMVGPPMPMLGGAGSLHNEVTFTDCAIPASHLLGREGEGFRLAMQCLDHGRTHWAFYCTGLASALLRLAMARATERRQFGRALADNQATQWLLADMAASLHAARLVARDAAWQFDHDPAGRTLWSAMAKLANADMVFRIADHTLQLYGGYGYCKNHPIERMWRESRVVRILDGTSEMMRQIVARECLKGVFPLE